MPLLDIWTTIWDDGIWYGLEQAYSINEDPAWISAVLMILIGLGGLTALMLLYPIAKD